MTPTDLEALCAAAMPDEKLTAAELERACFGPHDQVIGDRDAAVVVRSEPDGRCVVLLLAVDPQVQRAGRARALLDGLPGTVWVSGSPPFYLWPGVDVFATPALATFEACGFRPAGAEINMGIDTAFRAATPDGIVVERGDGRALAQAHFPQWCDEVAAGECWVATSSTGDVVAFGCHSVNRAGWIGPMATHPDWRGRGIGHAVLSALCADLMTHGVAVGEIAWVGPVGFYATAGASTSRVFRTLTRS